MTSINRRRIPRYCLLLALFVSWNANVVLLRFLTWGVEQAYGLSTSLSKPEMQMKQQNVPLTELLQHRKFWDAKDNRFRPGRVEGFDLCLDMQPQAFVSSAFVFSFVG